MADGREFWRRALGAGSPRRAGALVTLGFGLHLAFARLATLWEFEDTTAVAFWPAVGVVVGAAMAAERQWWFVIVGALVAKAVNQTSIEDDVAGRVVLAVLVAQAVEQVLATRLGLHVIQPPEIRRPSSRTTAFVVGGTALAASIGAALFVTISNAGDGFDAFRDWFVGDAVGIVLGAPTAYALGRARELPGRSSDLLELALTVLALGALTAWAFTVDEPVAFLVLPLVGWLALRFGLARTAPIALAVSMWATWRSSEGAGPFASFAEPVLSVQLFTAAVALITIVVGTLAIELDREHRRLGGLLAALPDLVLVVDDRGGIREDFASPTGDGPRVGRRDVDLVAEIHHDDLATARERWVEDGRARVTTEHVSETSGNRRIYETRVRRIGPDRAVSISRDVTDRRDSQGDLRRLSRRWRDVMAAAFEGIAELDEAGVFVEANDRLAAMLGRKSTALLGERFRDVLDGAVWPSIDADIERISNGERLSTTLWIDGRTVSLAVLPRLDAERRFIGALVVALDSGPVQPGMVDPVVDDPDPSIW